MPSARSESLDVSFFPPGVEVSIERQALPEETCPDPECGAVHPGIVLYEVDLFSPGDEERPPDGLTITMPAQVWMLIAQGVSRLALECDPENLMAMADHASSQGRSFTNDGEGRFYTDDGGLDGG